MSESGSAKAKKKVSVEDLTAKYTNSTARSEGKAKQEEAPAAESFAKIDNNTFFKIILNESLSPTEKKQAVAKALAFHEDKQQSKAALEEFEQFKAYLQFERKNMARKIIKLTDTETFSELKDVYSEINDALLEFEGTMRPLTDIVDSIYNLRMNDITFDIYEEIKRDKEAEEKYRILRAEQEEQLKGIEAAVDELMRDNAALATQKSLFGFGGIKAEAKEQIARNNVTLETKKRELAALAKEINNTSKHLPDSEFADFAEDKAKLRELLDISSDEHKARQEALVESASDFVNSTEARVGKVLKHFGGMNDQIDRLGDANFQMRSIYAILNEATKETSDLNQNQRETLTSGGEGEDEIAKLDREEKLRNLEGHITAIGKSEVDTTRVLAELTQAGQRVRSMKENNDQQISKTRALHTSGVAGVADQLSTVLQAVSSAALGEASAMAQMSLERMTDNTKDITAKEAFRVAMGHQAVNEDLKKALGDLEQFGDVVRATREITREGLEENRDILDRMEQSAATVQEEIRKASGVAADVAAGKGGARGEDADDDAERPSAFTL